MPAAFGSKFDRKSVEELCARRMKDYAQLGIFEFQPKGTLHTKASPKGPAPADVREKLRFPNRRSSKGHKGASKRSPRPVTPLKMWPNRADQFQPLEEVESTISDETNTSFEDEDPNLFVIGSSPRKKRNPKPNFDDTTKTPYASRPSLEMNGYYRNSVQADDARPYSLEIRNKCHRVRASASMKNPSIASELDPDLLETTDDEDNIIHTPYPEQLVVRSTSYRLDDDKPVLGVGREASVPALSTQSEFAPLPSRSVDCMGMKSWGFKWAANKLCRMPVVKRH